MCVHHVHVCVRLRKDGPPSKSWNISYAVKFGKLLLDCGSCLWIMSMSIYMYVRVRACACVFVCVRVYVKVASRFGKLLKELQVLPSDTVTSVTGTSLQGSFLGMCVYIYVYTSFSAHTHVLSSLVPGASVRFYMEHQSNTLAS